jgi:hypothetical protein
VPGGTACAIPDDAYDIIYSRFDLDSDEVVEVPRVTVNSCALQGGVDAEGWQTLGKNYETLRMSERSEAESAARGVQMERPPHVGVAG